MDVGAGVKVVDVRRAVEVVAAVGDGVVGNVVVGASDVVNAVGGATATARRALEPVPHAPSARTAAASEQTTPIRLGRGVGLRPMQLWKYVEVMRCALSAALCS